MNFLLNVSSSREMRDGMRQRKQNRRPPQESNSQPTDLTNHCFSFFNENKNQNETKQ